MAAVALMALFVVPASPVHAADGNRDNCRGYVETIARSGSNVFARYKIKCDRVQSKIVLDADVTRHTSGLPTDRASKTCRGTSTCTVSPRIANPSGRQLFSGAVFNAIAIRNGHKVGCGYVADFPVRLDGLMNCTARDRRL